MLRYATSFIVNHSEHPYFAGSYAIAAVFALAGAAVAFGTDHGLIAGFLVVYAILSAFVGTLGYAITFAVFLLRSYFQESDPAV